MGTSNFGRTHVPSGIIYAFATRETANEQFDLLLKDEAGIGLTEEDRDYHVDMFIDDNYKDTLDYAKDELNKIKFSKFFDGFYEKEGTYNGKYYFGYIRFEYVDKVYGNETAYIYCTVEHGYYESARLDIYLSHDGENWGKSVQKNIDRAINKIEKVYAKVCEIKLAHFATFSNGETFYKKA